MTNSIVGECDTGGRQGLPDSVENAHTIIISFNTRWLCLYIRCILELIICTDYATGTADTYLDPGCIS